MKHPPTHTLRSHYPVVARGRVFDVLPPRPPRLGRTTAPIACPAQQTRSVTPAKRLCRKPGIRSKQDRNFEANTA